VPTALQPVIDAVGERAGLLVLRDGRVSHAELDAELAGRGVRLGSLADVAPDDQGVLALTGSSRDALADLHDAFMADPAVLRVPPGVAVERPVVVAQWVDSDKAAVFPHLVVQAGAGSEVTVVDLSSSDDVAAFVDPVVELCVGDAANVRYLSVQNLGRRVWQTARLLSRAGRDATLLAWLAALGGEYARLYLDAELPGQGATTEFRGVYFGDDTQVHDFRSVQTHDAPRGRSNFFLKGAVVDEARGVYTGVIKVESGAKGTDAFLTNRNLVLSEGARVDAVPNLEIINENDLRNCGHAAATGPVDEEQLFYLESRGIPADVAERLIVLGFFDDILATVPVPSVRELLRQAVAAKLQGVGSGG
jgi:Fe-S cluster assembly protein SufD